MVPLTGATNPTVSGFPNGSATVSGWGRQVLATSDQMIIYQGSDVSPSSLIYGFSSSTTSGVSGAYDWHASATKAATSALPAGLTNSPDDNAAIAVAGSNGSASVTASTGIAAYTYSRAPSGGTSPIATGLSAGTYTVTVTDATSCSKTATVTITQPVSPVSGTTVVTNVACFGGSNGAINLTPSGGRAPYTFNWGYETICPTATLNVNPSIGPPLSLLEIVVLINFYSDRLFFYCSHSDRSARARYLLTQNGFTNITNEFAL
jgi:hypothetical protein